MSQMQSKKTGFILNDDDEGDAFTVDILKDEVYATPVFKVVSGSSFMSVGARIHSLVKESRLSSDFI